MSAKTPDTPYPDGARVTCVVTRVEPFGVFVRLTDAPETTGFIRPRDWSWSRRIFDIAADVPVGQEVEAQVIGRRGARRLELSRRLVLPDPFPAFLERHRPGDVVLGQVTLVAPNETGVVLMLEDGVEGFIPRAEVPDTEKDGFGLLVQDWVAGRILGYQKNQVRLSVKEYLRKKRREEEGGEESSTILGFHPEFGASLEDMRLTLQLGELAEPEIAPEVVERVKRVLVVEDSGNVSESLAMVFEHFGFAVDVAPSLERALERMAAHEHDLLIVDVNLAADGHPQESGVGGVELVRRLCAEATEAIVFVLTATSAAAWETVLQTPPNQTTCFFQKPTRITRLFAQLGNLVTGRATDDDRAFAAGLDPRGSPEALALARRGTSAAEKIDGVLQELVAETLASQAFVLAFRPGPHFELVAGSFPELTREVQQELELSPVGDVIRERRHLVVGDVAANERRFKHLLAVYPLASFAGIALPYADQAEYGLFLAGEKPQQLKATSEDRLRTTALLIGHYIAEERLDQVITENQALLLTGFLSDSLLHEIKNELQALADYSAVQALLGKKHKEDLKALSAPESLELKRSILGIQSVSKRLDELVVLFRNLAGQPGEESFDLNDSVLRLEETVKPFADARGVRLEAILDPFVPRLRASPKLIDQSLLNLMINGVEQMTDLPGSWKKLEVKTRYDKDAPHPVTITVADNGRGIHQVHRDKVFDLFFTTKARGTGLGLYLSRFFIEQLGGRLRLTKSVMFAGSEFVIELPKKVLT